MIHFFLIPRNPTLAFQLVPTYFGSTPGTYGKKKLHGGREPELQNTNNSALSLLV